MITLISTLILGLSVAGTSHAGEAKVTKDTLFTHEHPLSTETTFSIENQMGWVDFEAIDGANLTISGTTEGEDAITLKYAETAPGQYQIEVVYPPGTSSSGSVHISNISVSGGDIIIGDVVVGGPDRGVSVGPMYIPGRGQTTQTTVIIGPQPLRLKVGVPRSLLANLKIKTGSGDQEILGAFPGPFENKRVIDLQSNSGEIKCRDACAFGEFKIETGSGDVEIGKIRSNKGSIHTNSGSVELADVDGVFFVETGNGNVTSNGGAGPLKLKTNSGTVELNDANRTDLEVRSGSGDITVSGGSGFTQIKTNSGEVELNQRARGPVVIETGSGDVKLEDIGGDLRVEGNSSEVKATRITANVIQIETGNGDVKLRESTGRATIVTRSGEVKVSDHTKGSVDAKTGSGDIKFSNADESVVETASSRSGEVRKSKRAKKADADCSENMDEDIFAKMKKPGWPFN